VGGGAVDCGQGGFKAFLFAWEVYDHGKVRAIFLLRRKRGLEVARHSPTEGNFENGGRRYDLFSPKVKTPEKRGRQGRKYAIPVEEVQAREMKVASRLGVEGPKSLSRIQTLSARKR